MSHYVFTNARTNPLVRTSVCPPRTALTRPLSLAPRKLRGRVMGRGFYWVGHE